MKCKKCNSDLAEGAVFCGICGCKVEETKTEQEVVQTEQQKNVCPNCKRELAAGALFCAGCGKRVENEVQREEKTETMVQERVYQPPVIKPAGKAKTYQAAMVAVTAVASIIILLVNLL